MGAISTAATKDTDVLWQLAAAKAEGQRFARTPKEKQESPAQLTCSKKSMQAALRHCTPQPQRTLNL